MCRLKAFSRVLNRIGYAASLFCLEGMYKIRAHRWGGGGGGRVVESHIMRIFFTIHGKAVTQKSPCMVIILRVCVCLVHKCFQPKRLLTNITPCVDTVHRQGFVTVRHLFCV